MLKTIRIKSSHQSQGDFVVINELDFDQNKHEKYQEPDSHVTESSEPARRGRPPKVITDEPV